jgi:uncharacterized Zn-binding protein involved in type VI secretion
VGSPAIVMGDKVTGTCPNHLIIGPLGVPVPAPPMPFSAPLTLGLSTTVLIGGKPAALMGSTGYNTPPHVGLHPSDPFLLPIMEVGQVVTGSVTVMIDGKAAATGQSTATCCVAPGQIPPTVTNVLIG